MVKKNGILLLFFFLIGIELFSQERDLNFFPLTRQDGLSDNNITDIVKDKDGFMWIGTSNGLNRYDGYDFTVFRNNEDSTSLPDNNIKDLFVSQKGDLWLGFEHLGVSKFHPIDESFETFQLVDLPDFIEGSRFVHFCEDSDSNLYFITTNCLFIHEKGDSLFQNIRADVIPEELKLPAIGIENEIFAITPDENDGIWIAFSHQYLVHYIHNTKSTTVYKLDIQYNGSRNVVSEIVNNSGKIWIGGLGPEFYVFDPKTNNTELLLDNLNMIFVYRITESSDNSFWISSAGGLVHYFPDSKEYRLYTYMENDIRSLTNSAINCFFEDEAGIYWVGLLNSGINYSFKNLPFRKMITGLEPNQLSARDVTAILHDSKGNMWIALGSGVVEFHSFDKSRREIYQISSHVGYDNAGNIFSLMEDKQGNIYCSSWRGGAQKFNRSLNKFVPLFGSWDNYYKYIEGVDVRDIIEDEKGNLWLSVHGRGIYKINIENRKVKKFIASSDANSITINWNYQLLEDKDSNIWVSSAWGLSKINTLNDSVSRYFAYSGNGLNYDIHNFVSLDNQGNVWVGTDKGLNLYNKESDKFFSYTSNEGLTFENIRGMIQDNSGTYWVSTAYGLISFQLMYSRSEKPIIVSQNTYDIHDGLLQDNYYINSLSKDKDGRLYFGGVIGIDYFHPDEIIPYFTEPKLYITSLKVVGEKIFPGSSNGPPINKSGEIVLDYKQNLLSIDFVALNYFNTAANRYSYKLLPVSSNYLDLGKDRDLIFSNLKPEHYKLSLQVETGNGFILESPDILKFYIEPPFWQRTWFRYLSGLILAFILSFSVWLYTYNLRKKKDELTKLVNIRTKDLKDRNNELKEQANILNEANMMLSESKEQIENQAEELLNQSNVLEKTNKELVVLNSTKDKLFSIIAHDLKNPFNVIGGFTDLLNKRFDSYSDENKKELLANINEAVSTAHNLLENLLQWSLSQTGRLKVNTVELQVKKVLNSQLDLFHQTMAKKNLTLSVFSPDDVFVLADKDLLETVLRNLISNAFKFTASGGRIDVTAILVNEESMVEISVTDNGTGISHEILDKIFKIDKSISIAGTEGESGTGLGMLLCKEFVEKMKGQITIESHPGKGTKVSVKLPALLKL